MATSLLPDLSGDEFEMNARSMLKDDGEKLTMLLKLRHEALIEVSRFRVRLRATESAMPSAEEMNEAYNNFFDRAAKLLGYESFVKLFGVPPAEPVNIVDVEILAKAPRR
jgi:hypothetical protein